ncbi:MAG: class I SAM-dependent methyltransferase [Candidatus Lindowbacteria bacterium]|nr:class I SAM-dependent methyltransferase [Candidatus Lindowbacteria bacterium]
MKCSLCETEGDFEVITNQLRYGESKSAVKCPGCGLVFLDPPMTKEEEEKFYREEYGETYSKEKDTSPEELFELRIPEAEEYFKLVGEFVEADDDVLELGCASGYFLHYLRDKVKSVTGFEPFTEFQEYCRKMDIPLLDDLENVPDNSYDKVYMFFLVEHLTEPYAYMKNVARILRDGGKILFIVPNVDDVLVSQYKVEGFHGFYYTLAHPFYYSKETLSKMLTKCGFDDFEVRAHQRYDLSNHMNWMMTGKPGGQGRFNDIFPEELKDVYAKTLIDQFICDTLFGVVTIHK